MWFRDNPEWRPLVTQRDRPLDLSSPGAVLPGLRANLSDDQVVHLLRDRRFDVAASFENGLCYDSPGAVSESTRDHKGATREVYGRSRVAEGQGGREAGNDLVPGLDVGLAPDQCQESAQEVSFLLWVEDAVGQRAVQGTVELVEGVIAAEVGIALTPVQEETGLLTGNGAICQHAPT